ncbi:disulfide bond formation protein B [Rickettsiales bacterium]|nr:disulfide bond formation protein B [Rickettsiales bacterium]
MINKHLSFFSSTIFTVGIINISSIVGLLMVNVLVLIGFQPCMLCHIQRFIVFGLLLVSSMALFSHSSNSKKLFSFFSWSTYAIVLGLFFFGCYQLMVETGILPLPAICAVKPVTTFDLSQIANTVPRPPCNKIQYVWKRISVADASLIGSTLMLSFSLISMSINKKINGNFVKK